MNTLLTFTWDFTKGIDLGAFMIRFYSLLFAGGFVLGYFLMKKMFQKEGVSQQKLDTLVTYSVVAVIIGARLGHVFFYQWDYYSMHVGEIFMVWKGGLASHGAAISLIIAMYLFSRKELKKPTLWMLDRLVITVAVAACLIRLGNWFNSEIYGSAANSSMETVFLEPVKEAVLINLGDNIEDIDFELTGDIVETDSINYPVYKMSFHAADMSLPQAKEKIDFLVNDRIKRYVNSFDKENKNLIIPATSRLSWDADFENIAHIEVLGVPRHPTQIYEAFGYLIVFLILYTLYEKGGFGNRKGFIFGMFLILVFGFRFVIEYMKENQVSSEEAQMFNIGQYLSIPLVLAGAFFVLTAKKYKNEKID